MKGIELCKQFYYECADTALKTQFADVYSRMCVGVVGNGSECFFMDDMVSRDHDFEAGFTIFLTEDDYAKYGFSLVKFYNSLPKEYMGVAKQAVSTYKKSKFGVTTIEDFFESAIGVRNVQSMTNIHYLTIEESAMSTAVNGEIFFDNGGIMTSCRAKLNDMPRDVVLKKLSARLALMAQSGQYNYARCVERGDIYASQMSVIEFSKHTIGFVYTLNSRYCPYYKWQLSMMDNLPLLGDVKSQLYSLLTMGNDTADVTQKSQIISSLCAVCVEMLKIFAYTDATDDYLESHAFSLFGKIVDKQVRAMHIMDGVQ